MDLGLEGKVAIVTGASKGIGRAVAIALCEEGCRVVLCARGRGDLKDAVREVGRAGGEAIGIAADATNPGDVDNLVNETVAKFGTINVLVNNVGDIGSFSPVEELSDEQWLEILDLNLLSAVRLTRSVLPYMRKQRWGRVVNIASESGVQPDPVMPHYNASKAALINFTKSLSKACGADGVLVNAVSPAFIMTPLVMQLVEEEAKKKAISVAEGEASFIRDNRPNIVVGRAGTPEETAAVVAFLASEKASFVTGSNYRVDGGSVASL